MNGIPWKTINSHKIVSRRPVISECIFSTSASSRSMCAATNRVTSLARAGVTPATAHCAEKRSRTTRASETVRRVFVVLRRNSRRAGSHVPMQLAAACGEGAVARYDMPWLNTGKVDCCHSSIYYRLHYAKFVDGRFHGDLLVGGMFRISVRVFVPLRRLLCYPLFC